MTTENPMVQFDNCVLTENLREALDKLLAGLQSIFGETMESIILYGSVARGTATNESDVDIAVVVHGYTSDMHDRMIDLVVDLELDYDKVLSVLLVDYGNFAEWENVLPFYVNMKREGITLWSAA